MADFNTVKDNFMERLVQNVPIVDRVPGEHQPEFHTVRKLFEAICAKLENVEAGLPDLQEEFSQLRTVTNNYTVPDDVCETYAAVYQMLAELNQAYMAATSD